MNRMDRREVLVVGYPEFLSKKLVEKILDSEPDATLLLLVTEGRHKEVQELVAGYPLAKRKRVELFVGNMAALDLGLTGGEYRDLLARVTHVYHSGMSFLMKHPPRYLYERNVVGTKNLLDFCKEAPRLQRMFFYGSVHVSGDRTGYIREAEFKKGQTPKSHLEYTWYKAEELVRHNRNRVNYTIFRLGNIVGDSKTGEIDGFNGMYLVMALLLHHRRNRRLILPGSCNVSSHLIAADYAVDATCYISTLPESRNETYHITDPHSPPVHRVLRLLTSYLGARPPLFGVPMSLLKAAYLVPGFKAAVGVPLDVFTYLNHPVTYSTTNTEDALQQSGITCPDFEGYFPITIEYAERKLRQDRERRELQEAYDPLDTGFWEST